MILETGMLAPECNSEVQMVEIGEDSTKTLPRET